MAVQKVSEITVDDVINYLRIYDVTNADRTFIESAIGISKAYIKSYTGVEDLDDYDEFGIVVYILCQSMYDERSIKVNDDKLNTVFETILGFHRRNLL